MNTKIGFVGQGWIGRHYADDFEARGYEVIRYALEAPYNENKLRLSDCSIVFVAVPTPTTPAGFDDSVIRLVLKDLATTTIVVIKSTLLPGTTEKLQHDYPSLVILHSPEFLVEATAAHDAAHPQRNIIGIPVLDQIHQRAAEEVLAVLPPAPFSDIMPAKTAELVKYAGNCFLYTKVVFMNLLYDLATHEGVDWNTLRNAMVADPRIGDTHTEPIHSSGRGAGGHCFIKDFEAFLQLYGELDDTNGDTLLTALRNKNNQLLKQSSKDQELLAGVYGQNS